MKKHKVTTLAPPSETELKVHDICDQAESRLRAVLSSAGAPKEVFVQLENLMGKLEFRLTGPARAYRWQDD